MPNRTINLSVRMTQAEADALAAADIPGAETPSEKLRALIAALPPQGAERGDFAAMADEVTATLAPARRAMRAATGPRASDVLAAIWEHLPDAVAKLAVAEARLEAGEPPGRIEADAAADVAALAAELMHIAEMDAPRALDPDGLDKALAPLRHHGVGP